MTRGKMALSIVILWAVPLGLAYTIWQQRSGPLGPTYQDFVTNESAHPEGDFETKIVGYTIPGDLKAVRAKLHRDFGPALEWKTESHAIHRDNRYTLWIREFEGVKGPGLDPEHGPIHVDLSLKQRVGVITKLRRVLLP